jgi:phenylacetate-CoA ligase
MFIRGTQMDEVFKRFPEVAQFQAVVTREQHQDHLSYLVALGLEVGEPTALKARLAEALKDALKVRGEVEIVASGSIAPGSKKIVDRRVWK